MFLDGDDFLSPGAVETIIRNIVEYRGSSFHIYRGMNRNLQTFALQHMNDVAVKDVILSGFSSREVITKTEPRLYGIQPSTSTKVFDRRFLKDKAIIFEEGVYYEDYEHHFQCLNKADKVSIFNQVIFYASVERAGQITSKSGSARLDSSKVLNRVLTGVFQQMDSSQKRYAAELLLDFMHWNLNETNSITRKTLIAEYFANSSTKEFINFAQRNRKSLNLPHTLQLSLMCEKYSETLNDYYGKIPSFRLFRSLLRIEITSRVQRMVGRTHG